MSPRGSRFWHLFFRFQYRLLGLGDPLIHSAWKRFGIGNLVILRVARRSGGVRSRMVSFLRINDRLYVGHLDGNAGWTRDLAAAGEGTLIRHDGSEWHFSSILLEPGDERELLVRATNQHPFPGNLVHRLARRHIRAVAVYFRLDERV